MSASNELSIASNLGSQAQYVQDESQNLSSLALTAGGNIGVGTDNPTAKLQIINANQDANGNTLILGPTNQSNLRLGYDQNYSWIQSHGSKPLAINPLGNNVGVGTTNPLTKLDVNGGIRAQLTPPPNGAQLRSVVVDVNTGMLYYL